MIVEVESSSEADTLALGRRLAGLLRPGDVVLLAGRLGSGKTVFTSGLAEGLGIDDPITSPSFVLARTYDGFLPLVHADAYRLDSIAELEDLALDELASEAVVVVEWGQAVTSGFGEDRLTVEIEMISPDSRRIRFVPAGSWRGRALEELAE